MPNRCKKLQRKRKVDPEKKSAFKKSCLDKKSFGCSDEDYKECLRKYREKFPPDELDLKICENECKVSNNPSDCFVQCSIDYPMDKFEKSDPCEGIKEPLDKKSIDKFKDGIGVLIRREFTIKRPVPLFSMGQEVKYTEDGENGSEGTNVSEGKIIKINVNDDTQKNNTQKNIRNQIEEIVKSKLDEQKQIEDEQLNKLISKSISREEKNKIIV